MWKMWLQRGSMRESFGVRELSCMPIIVVVTWFYIWVYVKMHRVIYPCKSKFCYILILKKEHIYFKGNDDVKGQPQRVQWKKKGQRQNFPWFLVYDLPWIWVLGLVQHPPAEAMPLPYLWLLLWVHVSLHAIGVGTPSRVGVSLQDLSMGLSKLLGSQ